MKNVVLSLICFLFIQISFAQESEGNDLAWESSFKVAKKKAKKQGKPMLIYFTADWCRPCKALDKDLFGTKKFKELAKNDLILYKVKFRGRYASKDPDKLVIKENLKNIYSVKSPPALLMIDGHGNVVGRKTGLNVIEYYYPFIESIVETY